MHTSFQILGVVAVAALHGGALAQTSFPEVEPNSTKAEATPAAGMVAGDTLDGTTIGTVGTPGLQGLASVDTFRVKTAAAPLGIYRHTLALTTTGPAGHTGTLRGVVQNNGVIQNSSDVAFQTSATTTAVPRSNTWYGFGKQEEQYYRVTGTEMTLSPYVATLSTAAVTPISVAGAFNPGSITVSTFGQGHSTDTEIYVYDANLDPVPLGHNDSPTPASFTLSSVTVDLPIGTYYVAVSTHNLANNQSDLSPGEQWDDDNLLQLPNAMACNTPSTNVDVAFSVSDGATTTNQPATKMAAFDIVWATFTVGTLGTTTTPFCFGDGTGSACPCGNSGAAGNGCANSLNANGANIAGSGTASLASDTFTLTGTGMPNSSALYFQGSGLVAAGAGTIFGDGLRCTAGGVIRLGTKANALGTSHYPGVGDTPISVKGNNVAGNLRYYQVWYRNADVAFCPPTTFNLSNGTGVTWVP
jgi:hypothetical protein